MRALNSVGASGWSKGSAVVVTLSTTPSPIQFMEVLRVGLNWVDVGWIPASDDGGVAVTQYEIGALSLADGSAVAVVVVSEQQATTSADEHAARTTQQLAAVASATEDAEDSAAKLAFDRLEVLLGTAGGAAASSSAAPTPARTQMSIRAGRLTGLAAGTSYQLHVRPANENGWGATAASPLTFQTTTCKPDMPTCVRGAGVESATGAVLTWLPPVFDGGVGIELYTVQRAEYGKAMTADALVWGDDAVTDPPKAAGPCTCSLTGLERGKSYVFRVRARNAHGSSRWSEPSPPLLIAPTCPDEPHKPAATTFGPHAVLLSIDAAFSSGGFPVTAFATQCRAQPRVLPAPAEAGSASAAAEWADVVAKLVSSDEARARVVATQLVAHRRADEPATEAQVEATHDGHFDQAPPRAAKALHRAIAPRASPMTARSRGARVL
jgi:hypothetical protein